MGDKEGGRDKGWGKDKRGGGRRKGGGTKKGRGGTRIGGRNKDGGRVKEGPRDQWRALVAMLRWWNGARSSLYVWAVVDGGGVLVAVCRSWW